MTLEEVEGFLALCAAVKRLAWCGAERTDFLGVCRAAARTLNDARAQRMLPLAFRRRRDAVGTQLVAPFFADPVRRPGWRKSGFDSHAAKARTIERSADALLD